MKKLFFAATLSFLTAALFLFVPVNAEPPILNFYVCPTCAYTTIQSAVDAAPNPGANILVANGIYTANANQVILIQGKNLSIQGGFNSNFTAQNPITYPTIIDGQGLRAGMIISQSTVYLQGFVFIRGLDLAGGTVRSISSSTTIDGNYLLNPSKFTSTSPSRTGGPAIGVHGTLFFADGGNVKLENNVISGWQVGQSAVYLSNANFEVNYSTIFQKYDGQSGWAGIYAQSTLSPTVVTATNNIVSGFTTGVDGLAPASVFLTRTLWFSNTANTTGNVSTYQDRFGDPKLISPNTNNFDLQPDSPAISAGVCLPKPYDIIFRPRHCPSAIGAFEPGSFRINLPFVTR